MKFSELKEHIKQVKLFPVYILAGDDDFVMKLAKEQFLSLIELSEFNVSYANAGELAASAEVLPLGGALRVIFGVAKQLDELDRYLLNPNPSSVIVLTGELGKAKLPVGVQAVDCNRLEASLLIKYIASAVKKAGVSIEVSAANLLIDYSSRFLARIKIELDKLIGFCGEGGVISVDTIKAMVAPDLEYKVFELSDAIIKGNKERALLMLHDMLNEGAGSAQKVFGLLYSHFRRLLYVALAVSDDAGLAERLGVKDYAVVLAKRQAGKFSKTKLKELTDRLHEIDYGIKNGKIGDRMALESFILR